MASFKHDHTHLTSPDPEKTVEFYTEVMGAKVIGKQEALGSQMFELDLGGIPVRVSSKTGADEAWTGLRHGLHHLGLAVDNIEKTAAELKSKGAEFVVEPTQLRPGLKFAFIKAPDGVLLEVIEKSEG